MATHSVTEDDYVRAQYLHLRPNTTVALSALVLAGLIAYGLYASPSWVGLVAAAYFLSWLFIFVPWRARRHYRSTPAMAEPFTLAVTDEGLRFERRSGSTTVPWNRLRRWRYNRSLVLLYLQRDAFFLVARHGFADDAAYVDFLSALGRHLGAPR